MLRYFPYSHRQYANVFKHLLMANIVQESYKFLFSLTMYMRSVFYADELCIIQQRYGHRYMHRLKFSLTISLTL